MYTKREKVSIENTRLIYKTNFSGDPTRNPYGDKTRYFNIVIPTEGLAQWLIDHHVYVKETKPNPNYTYDEPFESRFFAKVIVNMESKWPPRVFWITPNGRKISCNIDTIGQLDYILKAIVLFTNRCFYLPGRLTFHICLHVVYCQLCNIIGLFLNCFCHRFLDNIVRNLNVCSVREALDSAVKFLACPVHIGMNANGISNTQNAKCPILQHRHNRSARLHPNQKCQCVLHAGRKAESSGRVQPVCGCSVH